MFISAGIIAISFISCGGGATQEEIAKEKVNNDLAKLNLKGKVVRIQQNLYYLENENDELTEKNQERGEQIYHTLFYKDWNVIGEMSFYTSFEFRFDEKGNVVKVMQNRDITYNFDDDIVISETWKYEDVWSEKWMYKYDEERLVSKKPTKDDDSPTFKYKYNDNGMLSKVTEEEKGEKKKEADLEYNNEGKIEKVQDYEFDNDGEKNNGRKIVFEYDENGNVSKMTISKGDDKIVLIFSKYKYDEQGNWIRRVIKRKDEDYCIVIIRKIRYDD